MSWTSLKRQFSIDKIESVDVSEVIDEPEDIIVDHE